MCNITKGSFLFLAFLMLTCSAVEGFETVTYFDRTSYKISNDKLSAYVMVEGGHLTAANQNIWMEEMRERIKNKYPDIEIVTVKPSQEDQQLAFQVTKDLLKAYPDLKGIFAITFVSLPGDAQAIKESGNSGKIALTGLSTPNSMRPYVKDDTVKEFVLWNPVDLGYLTVHAAKMTVEKGKLPGEFQAGKLGTIEVKDDMVLLGEPIIFNKDNIDSFDF